MLWSILKLSLASLRRQGVYSWVNVVGLSVAIASFLLIWAYLAIEVSYDRSYPADDRLLRVTTLAGGAADGSKIDTALSSPPVGPLMKSNFAEIEEYSRLLMTRQTFSAADRILREPAYWADGNFLTMFPFPMLQGDRATALVQPKSVVLTESLALKLFGATDVLGRDLQVAKEHTLHVSGVLRDLPRNTHFKFGILMSMDVIEAIRGDGILSDWYGRAAGYTYLRLANGASLARVREQMTEFAKSSVPPQLNNDFLLQPVSDIHLRSNPSRTNDMTANGSLSDVYTVTLIGAIVIAIACINFINIATSLSFSRAKEVGVRKVAGVKRAQIAAQFLLESLVPVTLATVIAVGICGLFRTFFGTLFGIDRVVSLGHPQYWLSIILAIATVTVIGGGVSAWRLSALDPLRCLRGEVLGSALRSKGQMRGIFVVLQFVASIALLCATGVLFWQYSYARNVDLGYDARNMLVVGGAEAALQARAVGVLKDELEKVAGVRSVTMSSLVPPVEQMDRYGIRVPGRDQQEPALMPTNSVLPSFFEDFGIALVAGRTFQQLDRPDDLGTEMLSEAVLSVSAARQFGWADPAAAVGNTIEFQTQNKTMALQVVGIVEDVNMATVRRGAQPLVYVARPVNYRFFDLQLDDASAATVERLQSVWRKFLPGESFDSQLMADRLEQAYLSERKQMALVGLFAALGVSISLLGVIALALFQATRRSKEVAIRKVLGARTMSLLGMLAVTSMRQVAIAGAIAIPLTYYIMQKWLSGFAYRVNVSVLFYVGIVALTAVVASLMVFAVTLRVVRRPPALSLGTE